jgi:ATP-dependent RNA helicase DeaD
LAGRDIIGQAGTGTGKTAAEAIHKYGKQTTLTVVPLYGGAPMDQQIRALRRGVDVVVATPGRALRPRGGETRASRIRPLP